MAVPRTGFARSLDSLYDYLDNEIPLGLLRSNAIKWVHSGTGVDDVNHGDVDTPYATVDYAVGTCTSARGDLIVVKEGHAETVTSSNMTLDVAGITIINLGRGLSRPTYTYGAAAATINVGAANISWIGGHFVGNFDNVAAAFTVGAADDFTLQGASFYDNTAALHFLSIVVTTTTDNAADGLAVLGNFWMAKALAPNAFISILGDLERLRVEDNDCQMLATNDVGHFITFAAKNGTGTRIRRNTLMVTGSTNAAVGIFLTGSGTGHTGFVAENYVTSIDTTGELIATAGTGLAFFDNLYTGVADKSGKLWPVVDAA